MRVFIGQFSVDESVLSNLLELDIKSINGFVDKTKKELAYSYDDGYEDLESTSIEASELLEILKENIQ